MALLESCIWCGLIQSNSGYDELFAVAGIRAKIADGDYNIVYSSTDSDPLPVEVMQQTENGPVLLKNGMRLSGAPIRGGRVIWSDDVSELAGVLKRLEDNRESLAESNLLEKENYDTLRKISILREKNRLYDLLQRQTARQNALLDTLLEEYDAVGDEAERRRLLCRIAVIGAYVKRSGNLLFIRQQSENISSAELSHAIEESLSNLELTGAECALLITPGAVMPTDIAIRIYGFFEGVVEAALDNIRSLWMNVRCTGSKAIVRIELESGAELAPAFPAADSCICEDGIWSLSTSFEWEEKRNG